MPRKQIASGILGTPCVGVWCGTWKKDGLRFALLDNRLEGLNDLGSDGGISSLNRGSRWDAGGEGSWVGHVGLLSELLLHGRRPEYPFQIVEKKKRQ